MKLKTIFALTSFLFISLSCDVLKETASQTMTSLMESKPTNSSEPKKSLSNNDIIAGLKEALIVSATNSVKLTSATDGFFGNALIQIPFPQDAIKMKQALEDIGFSSQVASFEKTLNRAAEEASKDALPIFKEAILTMTITDGLSILKGGEGAATKFLKEKTSQKLIQTFSPKVKTAISKVYLTRYWEPLTTKYNKLISFAGGETVNTNLENYVTEKTVSGLFFMLENEENKIRKDPVARVTQILKDVFESL